MSSVDLSTDIGSVRLKNPVITASGTCGYGLECARFYQLDALGALSVKGLHINPQTGNPPLRIIETPSGMLNAIGLQGISIRAFASDKMPKLRAAKASIIANFWGKSLHEYQEALRQLNNIDDLLALEVNVSCPNIKEGGIHFGTNERLLGDLIRNLRKESRYPLIVKLSPNVTDITQMARIVESEGADALSLVNTFTAMCINVKTRKPFLANISGGLSGPAIRPIAVRMVWEVAQAVTIPIIGMGGIMTANDALEFILAGAAAVQVGTASFVDPQAPLHVLKGIENYCRENSANLVDLIGALNTAGFS